MSIIFNTTKICLLFLCINLTTHSALALEYFSLNQKCQFRSGKNTAFVGDKYKIIQDGGQIINIDMGNNKIDALDKQCGTIYQAQAFWLIEESELPAEPTIEEAEQNIVVMCGMLGSEINEDEIIRALEQNFILQQVYENLDHSLKVDNIQTFFDFKKTFIELWIKSGAFKKIFCGNIKNGNLEGMNYIGRYVDMYKKGWAASDISCKKNFKKHPLYFWGIVYENKEGKIFNQCLINHFYTLSMKDIIVEASKAYKKFSKSNGQCIHYIMQNDDAGYAAILTKENNSISGFDATIDSCEDCECK